MSKVENKYTSGRGVKYIHVKDEKIIIDSEDYELVKKCGKWRPHLGKVISHLPVKDGNKQMVLARLVLGLEDNNLRYRHINGNKLDCRKENLKLNDPNVSPAPPITAEHDKLFYYTGSWYVRAGNERKFQTATGRYKSKEAALEALKQAGDTALQQALDNRKRGTLPVFSKGVIYEVLIDEADYKWLSKTNWHHVPAKNGRQYIRNNSGKYMHRAIMEEELKQQDGKMDIDHINRNTLDNRRANLRVLRRGLNNMNAPKSKKRSGNSKYRGVTFDKRRIKAGVPWFARVQLDNRVEYLGSFRYETQAAIARDLWIIKNNLEEFNMLNFPSMEEQYRRDISLEHKISGG